MVKNWLAAAEELEAAAGSAVLTPLPHGHAAALGGRRRASPVRTRNTELPRSACRPSGCSGCRDRRSRPTRASADRRGRAGPSASRTGTKSGSGGAGMAARGRGRRGLRCRRSLRRRRRSRGRRPGPGRVERRDRLDRRRDDLVLGHREALAARRLEQHLAAAAGQAQDLDAAAVLEDEGLLAAWPRRAAPPTTRDRVERRRDDLVLAHGEGLAACRLEEHDAVAPRQARAPGCGGRP